MYKKYIEKTAILRLIKCRKLSENGQQIGEMNFHSVVFWYFNAFAYDSRTNFESDCQFTTKTPAKRSVFDDCTQIEMKINKFSEKK